MQSYDNSNEIRRRTSGDASTVLHLFGSRSAYSDLPRIDRNNMVSPQTEDGYTGISNEIIEALYKINLLPYESRNSRPYSERPMDGRRRRIGLLPLVDCGSRWLPVCTEETNSNFRGRDCNPIRPETSPVFPGYCSGDRGGRIENVQV
jgi:hypothetical protein